MKLLNIVFLISSFPLVVQDTEESTVSVLYLTASFTLWCLVALFSVPEPAGRFMVAASVLIVGAVVLSILPERLGPADVVFISGIAVVFPYYSFMLAVALSCVAGLALFAWIAREGGVDLAETPIPFLPSLFWGSLTISIRGLLP